MRPETILTALALFGAFTATVLLIVCLHSVRRRRTVSAVFSLLSAVIALLVAALAATILIGTRGYSALTQEQVAAEIRTVPQGEHRFTASVRMPDGRTRDYAMRGDELYVDAHILKWKPIATVFGLRTGYELSRLAGRYSELDDERHADRSVYDLSAQRPIDLFHLRRASKLLAPIVDAEYGSASFVAVRDSALWELRVSSSGLLLREVEP
jgi:hypothetical protein